MPDRLYQWTILQKGKIPLKPDMTLLPFHEHACTTTLIWPCDQQPDRSNSLIIDPCFTDKGFRRALKRLGQLGVAFSDIGFVLITHGHIDHAVRLPDDFPKPDWPLFDTAIQSRFPGISVRAFTGHHPFQNVLVVPAIAGDIWVVGDAVLDLDWLKAWGFYWPNRYSKAEVIRTWRDVADIITRADIVIPGHGPPIEITIELIDILIAAFDDKAKYASECPDVIRALQAGLIKK